MSNVRKGYEVRRGLDRRAVDSNGQIREKNGAAKIKNLVGEIPQYRVFSPEATITNLRKYYKVSSEKDLRKIASIKLKAKKFGA